MKTDEIVEPETTSASREIIMVGGKERQYLVVNEATSEE
jgi:hypothetical protein